MKDRPPKEPTEAERQIMKDQAAARGALFKSIRDRICPSDDPMAANRLLTASTVNPEPTPTLPQPTPKD